MGIGVLEQLTDKHVHLGRLAERLSEELGQASLRLEIAFMCLFTKALFAGELDGPAQSRFPFRKLAQVPVLPSTMQIPVFTRSMKEPATGTTIPGAFWGWQDGDRLDVAFLLQQLEVLPPEAADYPKAMSNDQVLEILTHVPYSSFPVTAQALIDNVRIAKPKLRHWLAERGLELPSGLAVERKSEAEETQAPPKKNHDVFEGQNDNRPVRGRPSKKAWALIIKNAKRMHADDPSKMKKCVANDVYELALQEFEPGEVPSPATIQRRMKRILKG